MLAIKFRGIDKEDIVYYLKKLEFMYNFRYNLNNMLYSCLGKSNYQIKNQKKIKGGAV